MQKTLNNVLWWLYSCLESSEKALATVHPDNSFPSSSTYLTASHTMEGMKCDRMQNMTTTSEVCSKDSTRARTGIWSGARAKSTQEDRSLAGGRSHHLQQLQALITKQAPSRPGVLLWYFFKIQFSLSKNPSFCLAGCSESNIIYMPDEYVVQILLQ